MPDAAEFHERMQRVEQCVHEIESLADPGARDRCVELASLLMELHAAGLARILELLPKPGPGSGENVTDRLARDPLAASLLLLHGLHPVPLETRVRQALEQVRPRLESHGGSVELLGIDAGVVRLRFAGNCSGCPSSLQTLKNSIEQAIYELAPDVVELRTEDVPRPQKPAGFVPLESLA